MNPTPVITVSPLVACFRTLKLPITKLVLFYTLIQLWNYVNQISRNGEKISTSTITNNSIMNLGWLFILSTHQNWHSWLPLQFAFNWYGSSNIGLNIFEVGDVIALSTYANSKASVSQNPEPLFVLKKLSPLLAGDSLVNFTRLLTSYFWKNNSFL